MPGGVVGAALDHRGALLGVEPFATTRAGYRGLLSWLGGFGEVALVGVEGTGSYGAGLIRHLHREGIGVVEVDRPNRKRRRQRASLIPSSPRLRPGPRSPATPGTRPRLGTDTSRPCGCSGSRCPQHAKPAPSSSAPAQRIPIKAIVASVEADAALET